MKAIFIRVLVILLAIAFVVLAYYVTIWVLGLLGLHIPEIILRVAFVILGLLMAIWALTGRMDSVFNPPIG